MTIYLHHCYASLSSFLHSSCAFNYLCILLYYTIVCYCAVLYYIGLYCTCIALLYSIVLYCIIALYGAVLCCTEQCCIVLYYCIVLCCIVLYCIVLLHSMVLYCVVLYSVIRTKRQFVNPYPFYAGSANALAPLLRRAILILGKICGSTHWCLRLDLY